MDCADFHTAFALTLEYHFCFEEYGRVDFAVFAEANVGANVGAIVDCYEEVFEDLGATSRPRASQY